MAISTRPTNSLISQFRNSTIISVLLHSPYTQFLQFLQFRWLSKSQFTKNNVLQICNASNTQRCKFASLQIYKSGKLAINQVGEITKHQISAMFQCTISKTHKASILRNIEGKFLFYAISQSELYCVILCKVGGRIFLMRWRKCRDERRPRKRW